MAEISKESLSELVARVTEGVYKEMRGHEATIFGVADLHDQLTGLAKIGSGESAWTISYSTAKGSIAALGEVAKIGGENAWTISYSTSKTGIERSPLDRGVGQ